MGSTRAAVASKTEDLDAWLTRLHDGRRRNDLAGERPDDDVMDPMGGTRQDYRQMLTDVSGLTETLRNLAWPVARPRPLPGPAPPRTRVWSEPVDEC